MQELRFVGPPGTGKSTELARQARLAAERFGGDNVMICSLTRAAAAEIGGRETGIPANRVGTLHSFAYRSCDSPQIADTPKRLREWNEWIKEAGHPYLQISTTQPDTDESAIEGLWGGETLGDRHYGAYQVARARRQGLESLPEPVQNFARHWHEWMDEFDLMDFAGTLEYCLEAVDTAPGSPEVIFMDEAQDTSLLGMQLLRKWASRARALVIFGDPLQNLYQWAGTDPEAFTTPEVPLEHKRVLSQSYRVPRTVHTRALAWIAPLKQELERQLGRPIEYEPRDAEGEVRQLGAHFKYPEPALKDAEKYLAAGKSVMFLAACSHMLDPLLAVLRREGIPFHNPWRAKRGDWNPFGKRTGTTARERVLSFLRLSPEAWESPALWSSVELWQWVEVLEAEGVLLRGAKKRIELQAKEPLGIHTPRGLEDLSSLFAPGILDEALLGSGETDLDWFRRHLLAAKARSFAFPLTVCERRSPAALRAAPQIIVGTIHSLKGSEADVVYVFPDLSEAGMQEWCGNLAARAGILRAFYVAMTRAREGLILCAQATPLAVRL